MMDKTTALGIAAVIFHGDDHCKYMSVESAMSPEVIKDAQVIYHLHDKPQHEGQESPLRVNIKNGGFSIIRHDTTPPFAGNWIPVYLHDTISIRSDSDNEDKKRATAS